MDTSGDPFEAASEFWDLQRLYGDLAIAKGSQLTPKERVYLKGLLLGYRPNDIAEVLQVQSISARKYCSNLYAYIGDLLISQVRQAIASAEVQAMGVRANRVAWLLDQAGYRLSDARGGDESPLAIPATIEPQTGPPIERSPHPPHLDEVPVLSVCYGRDDELATLTQLHQSGSRFITLYGDYGIGKTTLLKRWVHGLKAEFDRVIWRSLRGLPSCAHLLADLLSGFSQASYAPDEPFLERHLALLMHHLQQQRVLLVLEDADSVLEDESRLRQYRAGFEAYEHVFQRLAALNYPGLVVLETWEPLADLELLEKSTATVRSLKLKKLSKEAAIRLLEDYELQEPECWSDLIDLYRNNPYALRVVAAHIEEVFDGHVREFCQDHTTYLGNISNLLHHKFKRLSGLEKEVLLYLTQQEGNPISRQDLQQHFQGVESCSNLNEAIGSLSRRSLIERSHHNETVIYRTPPVIAKYIKNQRANFQ